MQAIAERAGAPRGEVSLPDVMLAVQSRAQHAFVQPPSQQVDFEEIVLWRSCLWAVAYLLAGTRDV